MQKTVLVVGGAGYVGSHQVKMLDEKGYDVIVYDNLSTGYRDLVTVDKFEKGDLADKDKLREVFSKYEIDAVMHFAAFMQVEESVKKPDKYYNNNLVNSINLLDVMLEYDVKNFIFSSTAAVYGESEIIPIKEEQIKNPVNPYGKSKMMVEEILKDYNKAYGLKYACFRYFNASGADEKGTIGEKHSPETHLIPLVLEAALGEREEIYIYGTDYDTKDGTCIRDFIHVNDLAKAHIKGLERLFDGGSSEFFNLGSSKGYSVKEIIDTVKDIVGVDFKVVECDRRLGDISILVADGFKAKKYLDWKIKYDLNDIIQTALNWNKNNQ